MQFSRMAPLSQRLIAVATKKRGVSRQGLSLKAASTPPPAPKPTEDWRAAEAERQRIQEESRQRTAEAKKIYDKQQAVARGTPELPAELQIPLADLPASDYVDSDGCIVDLSEAGAKATVYAILDKESDVRYVGVTRSITPSLRLHMARKPKECYAVKVLHIARPSRATLEAIRSLWIQQCGTVPGNDEGVEQDLWENPFDCKKHMSVCSCFNCELICCCVTRGADHFPVSHATQVVSEVSLPCLSQMLLNTFGTCGPHTAHHDHEVSQVFRNVGAGVCFDGFQSQDEDRATVAAANEGPERNKAMKVVARKFEADIMEVIASRGITERFRFDPKLKETGMLDLKNMEAKPSTAVPSN